MFFSHLYFYIEAVPLTTDLKPDLPEERERIELTGGAREKSQEKCVSICWYWWVDIDETLRMMFDIEWCLTCFSDFQCTRWL